MLNIGGNNVKVAIGNSEVKSVYIGSQQVYPNGVPISGEDYTAWVYNDPTRTRTATPWTAMQKPDGTIYDRVDGEPYTQTDTATVTSNSTTWIYSIEYLQASRTRQTRAQYNYTGYNDPIVRYGAYSEETEPGVRTVTNGDWVYSNLNTTQAFRTRNVQVLYTWSDDTRTTTGTDNETSTGVRTNNAWNYNGVTVSSGTRTRTWFMTHTWPSNPTSTVSPNYTENNAATGRSETVKYSYTNQQKITRVTYTYDDASTHPVQSSVASVIDVILVGGSFNVLATGGTYDLKDSSYISFELSIDNVRQTITTTQWSISQFDSTNSDIDDLVTFNSSAQTAIVASRGQTWGDALQGFMFIQASFNATDLFEEAFNKSFSNNEVAITIQANELLSIGGAFDYYLTCQSGLQDFLRVDAQSLNNTTSNPVFIIPQSSVYILDISATASSTLTLSAGTFTISAENLTKVNAMAKTVTLNMSSYTVNEASVLGNLIRIIGYTTAGQNAVVACSYKFADITNPVTKTLTLTGDTPLVNKYIADDTLVQMYSNETIGISTGANLATVISNGSITIRDTFNAVSYPCNMYRQHKGVLADNIYIAGQPRTTGNTTSLWTPVSNAVSSRAFLLVANTTADTNAVYSSVYCGLINIGTNVDSNGTVTSTRNVNTNARIWHEKTTVASDATTYYRVPVTACIRYRIVMRHSQYADIGQACNLLVGGATAWNTISTILPKKDNAALSGLTSGASTVATYYRDLTSNNITNGVNTMSVYNPMQVLFGGIRPSDTTLALRITLVKGTTASSTTNTASEEYYSATLGSRTTHSGNVSQFEITNKSAVAERTYGIGIRYTCQGIPCFEWVSYMLSFA